jgi:signal transduction histidine kinase
METIFTNLFINANKYSGGNPVWSIEINFEEKSYDIKISDNGIGIPENELPNIFNSFFRGSNTAGITGTGIGLVTVKQMVEEHNGIISVKNNDSGGITFKITFPDK